MERGCNGQVEMTVAVRNGKEEYAFLIGKVSVHLRCSTSATADVGPTAGSSRKDSGNCETFLLHI